MVRLLRRCGGRRQDVVDCEHRAFEQVRELDPPEILVVVVAMVRRRVMILGTVLVLAVVVGMVVAHSVPPSVLTVLTGS
jgi:hypothetical protein